MNVTSAGLATNMKCSTIRDTAKRVNFVLDRPSAAAWNVTDLNPNQQGSTVDSGVSWAPQFS